MNANGKKVIICKLYSTVVEGRGPVAELVRRSPLKREVEGLNLDAIFTGTPSPAL